jgi:hypothetical protein
MTEPLMAAFRRLSKPKAPAATAAPRTYVLGRFPQESNDRAGAPGPVSEAAGLGGGVTFIPVRPLPFTVSPEGDAALDFVSQAVAIANASALPASRIEVLSDDLLDWAAFCIQPGAETVGRRAAAPQQAENAGIGAG